MNRLVAFALLASLVLPLSACGKEIARVPLKGAGTGSTTLTVKKGEPLALWTSLDVTYDGDLAARYDVRLVQGGTAVASTTCNPIDVGTKMMSTEVNVNDNHRVSYQGKMRCSVSAPADGPATLDVTLTFAPRTSALTVRDISLVVKR